MTNSSNKKPDRLGKAWHARACDEALSELESQRSGLAEDEAGQRLRKYGPNKLQEIKAKPWWHRLLQQFNNILMVILIVAAIASLGLGQRVDAAAILGVVVIIALIGFLQEGKAEKALESIRNMMSPQANVVRSGARQTITAEDLVPGDIVIVESGDRVPADLRLLRAKRFRTQEAPLTGESEPVDKTSNPVPEDAALAERHSMAYAGTNVVQGNALGLVVATATRTEIGRISELLRHTEKLRTPLLDQLDRAGRVLAMFILMAAAVTAAVGIVVHGESPAEMFMAAVGLAVAAIPEGLPAIVTIALALGVQAMARRNAIIRRLPAVETLGSISMILSDKTGTLTRNEMTAVAIWLEGEEIVIDGIGFAPEGEFHHATDGVPAREALAVEAHPALRHFLRVGVLCNDAELARADGQWSIQGDPTEGALVVAAAKAGFDAQKLRDGHERYDAIPFESERKYMATLHDVEDRMQLLVKGAPDRLIEMCHWVRTDEGEAPLNVDHWRKRIEALSARGLRVLALAEKEMPDPAGELETGHVEEGLVLLGLVGLLDPPREEVIEAVKKCRNAGIRPVMITGDHASTARAIAEKLGFAHTDRALTGNDIESLSEEGLRACLDDVDVFARAAPEHKLRLVEAVQSKGNICAMTGDGVNDGPALKRADVGVAMGIQGTAAARDAAEMVLADDNFASIVNAIEEGRKVYDNIRKTITFLLPTNGGQALTIMIAVLAGGLLPITPLQALWVNMVVAVTLGMALAFEPAEKDIMQRQPRDPTAGLLDMFLLWRVIFVSILLLIGVFGMFAWVFYFQENTEALARAGAVNMLVMGSAAYLINSRFLVNSALSVKGIFGSRSVWLAIGLVVLMQLIWTYLPFMQMIFGSDALTLAHWTVILIASIALFLIVELEKSLLRRSRMGASRSRID